MKTIRSLDASLRLVAAETDAQVDKVIAINDEIHQGGPLVRYWLFAGHPSIRRSDWLYIEDIETGEAVSTLCLIPLTWRYGKQSLPVAELGFVATLPAYRQRGLQRVLAKAFEQLALSQGCTLAAIEGIPGFYGQFGYEYAVPLLGRMDLEFDQAPDSPKNYTIKTATLDDVPTLQKFYDASIASLDIAALRDAATWAAQLSAPPQVQFYGQTALIERQGQVVGYVRWNENDEWVDRVSVLELAVDAGPQALEAFVAALRFVAERGRLADKQGLCLRLPANHPLIKLANYWGGIDHGYYGWQIKALDPLGFMQAIVPSLQERLDKSLLAGYSGSLVFELYRSRLALRFAQGKLVEVNAPEGQVEADAEMTLDQAMQLWLGWRDRQALQDWNPDFWTKPAAHHLIDVLFPKTQAYIYTPY